MTKKDIKVIKLNNEDKKKDSEIMTLISKYIDNSIDSKKNSTIDNSKKGEKTPIPIKIEKSPKLISNLLGKSSLNINKKNNIPALSVISNNKIKTYKSNKIKKDSQKEIKNELTKKSNNKIKKESQKEIKNEPTKKLNNKRSLRKTSNNPRVFLDNKVVLKIDNLNKECRNKISSDIYNINEIKNLINKIYYIKKQYFLSENTKKKILEGKKMLFTIETLIPNDTYNTYVNLDTRYIENLNNNKSQMLLDTYLNIKYN